MSDFLRENPIGDTDSYKTSHYLQYPPGMSGMFSYLESRGGEFDRTVFFGLQYIIKRFLQALVETADIDEMETFCKLHQVPFPRKGMERVRDLGYFPVCIRAVREGTVVPVQNVLMSVESTDPETFWIVGWLETILMRIWYPITVATLSWHCKKDILGFLVRSADEPMSEIDYKLHDFGSRGSSSSETALIGGMAHCANFKGSDNILAVRGANFYYRNEMAATSIPAAEHSTITSWGRENEIDAYRNMIAQFAKPGKMLAVVSDSYDLYNVVENVWGELLRESVESSGAKLVMRPDSGVPVIVVPKYLRLLDSKIPFALNTKGYKILPPYYGLLQGDGVNHRAPRTRESVGRFTRTRPQATRGRSSGLRTRTRISSCTSSTARGNSLS